MPLIKLTKHIRKYTQQTTPEEYIYVNPDQILYLEQISTPGHNLVTDIKMTSNVLRQVLETPDEILNKMTATVGEKRERKEGMEEDAVRPG